MAFVAPVQTGDLIQASTVNGLVNGSIWYSLDTGIVNAYKVTFNGAAPNLNKISALTDGLIITFKALIANSGPSTLEVIGASGVSLGVLPIVRGNGNGLVLGFKDIRPGMITVIYNSVSGGRFELLTPTTGPTKAARCAKPTDSVAANAAWTVQPLSLVLFDNGPFFNAASPNQLTIPTSMGGAYVVTLTASFEANSVGARYADILVNSVSTGARTSATSWVSESYVMITAILRFSPGDIIQNAVWQNSGGGLNVQAIGTTLSLAWLGL